ncbi:hypothetical protein A3D05_03435 [Candidatus Gottesmanbacteria bacterium RIFCSPHIGHO2_02_FULL_40_24]|uniref:Phosphopantothenate/pantothenate synthetase n=1 Tax=Candidatus Gottesmanbacteria bacterium RIFCSPHIGHO2_01_FULL_40_15 TaxID=1798376 RepID=A0A1F5Z0L2_9BACT|nr:MAG: hypothetical protein A2777_02560 [Candidatus Gottesmanbacteria bacterium RIFCSPHIGHO2_01_FULL_40_15]OGG17886.1 MAG: hypothetical protein A3D05_03435 [Candidatus Gottesmanbacteria bacterium RIFCSPHIGHO2_02_FULL_40_24]OGG21753.1 MAG: hypothetical protein A3B48_03585 [Candidatus Gottesmanbacteria bacterium RIFCSPLOWO2_01_FULL_40_10]OGG24727.1 MAG: hypothetical protein A3E42_01615 [Candidatus Gottesmanbacteria bacterium RIFCSPHIGHO2_12_FULL_40_13]OGG32005.1 MAG: hypothetical protein A3I80_0
MKIDKAHPRAQSLILREKLVEGIKSGITSQAGLIAHGRGEAFDYLIGEKTNTFAEKAITAASAQLLLARKPILSINGNAAALCSKDFIKLSQILDCKIEVNLFHHSKIRVSNIEKLLSSLDASRILSGKNKKIKLKNIASRRANVLKEGIGTADCIFVPLEDGDRCLALRKLGKIVITVDLNPLSRTSRSASVTIVDNIVRCLPLLNEETVKLKRYKPGKLKAIIQIYNNQSILNEAISVIRKGVL